MAEMKQAETKNNDNNNNNNNSNDNDDSDDDPSNDTHHGVRWTYDVVWNDDQWNAFDDAFREHAKGKIVWKQAFWSGIDYTPNISWHNMQCAVLEVHLSNDDTTKLWDLYAVLDETERIFMAGDPPLFAEIHTQFVEPGTTLSKLKYIQNNMQHITQIRE